MTSERALAVRDPESALQVLEAWADLPADERKRRAAEASQTLDRPKLRGLLNAHVGMYGRKGVNTSRHTLRTYWQGAARLLNWAERNAVKPHQIGEHEARRFMASMGELAPKTRQVYLTGAKSLIAALRWAGLGEGDPFEHIRVFDPTSRTEKADPYSAGELARLLGAVREDRERALVLLAADAGLRLSEVAGLDWESVDFERSRITVTGKGAKRATVGATARTLDALRALGPKPAGGVFGISPRRVQQIFKRLAQRAEVKPRGFHNLRHTCGTRLYELTANMKVVQRHLRHESIKTTEIYAHLAEGDYEAAISGLGAFSANGKESDDGDG